MVINKAQRRALLSVKSSGAALQLVFTSITDSDVDMPTHFDHSFLLKKKENEAQDGCEINCKLLSFVLFILSSRRLLFDN